MKTYDELRAENDRLRGACRLALDWCTGEGRYSEPGSDSTGALAETVAPTLGAALGDRGDGSAQMAALIVAAQEYAEDQSGDTDTLDGLTEAALDWWGITVKKVPR